MRDPQIGAVEDAARVAYAAHKAAGRWALRVLVIRLVIASLLVATLLVVILN